MVGGGAGGGGTEERIAASAAFSLLLLLPSLFHRFFQRLKYSFASVPRVISFPLPSLLRLLLPFLDLQGSARESERESKSFLLLCLSLSFDFRRENSKQRWEEKKGLVRFILGFWPRILSIWRDKGCKKDVKRVLWSVNDRAGWMKAKEESRLDVLFLFEGIRCSIRFLEKIFLFF